jgi:hypothetical protein
MAQWDHINVIAPRPSWRSPPFVEVTRAEARMPENAAKHRAEWRGGGSLDAFAEPLVNVLDFDLKSSE